MKKNIYYVFHVLPTASTLPFPASTPAPVAPLPVHRHSRKPLRDSVLDRSPAMLFPSVAKGKILGQRVLSWQYSPFK